MKVAQSLPPLPGAAEDDATSALAKADKAMYVQKRRGTSA